jgi:chitodextrinase
VRALARYSTAVIAGFIVLPVACRDAVAPDAERLQLDAGAASEARKSGNRGAPTTPTNLRITATGARSVSLAWGASTDDSGDFTYRIVRSGGLEFRVPSTQTTFTWSTVLHSGQTYSFYVYAQDAAGNKSNASNTVTVTLPPDTQAPTAPVLSSTNVGPTHISLAWSATDDDGPNLVYSITINGAPDPSGATTSTSRTYSQLQPATSYTFTGRARDASGNLSPVSEPLTVTTRSSDFSDTEAPTAPTNLWADSYGDLEFQLWWTASTDNVDPQSSIRYEIFVNGKLENIIIGASYSRSNYGVSGSNTVTVIAIDAAGNKSAAGTTTIQLF